MAEASAKTEYLVGVDLGGTKILAGVFDDKLSCLGRTKMSTKSERGAEEVVDRIALDPETGRVIFAPNLQWQDVPLKKMMEKQLGVTVAVENDCNSATLGVFEKELQSKPRYMVGIFIGTGIGGGMIIDGKLYPGFSGTAAEVGHMVIQVGGPKCNCGNRGCFEALASRTAIFRAIHTAIKDGQKTILTELLGRIWPTCAAAICAKPSAKAIRSWRKSSRTRPNTLASPWPT
jgi:glucokinase